VELGVLGPIQVRHGGVPVMIRGAKPRAILTMLGLHSRSVVSADALLELLWGDDLPRTAAKALQTHISSCAARWATAASSPREPDGPPPEPSRRFPVHVGRGWAAMLRPPATPAAQSRDSRRH
jgi:hypothetical protein